MAEEAQKQEMATSQSSSNQGCGGLIMSSCCSVVSLIGCGVLLTLAFTKSPPGK